MDHPTHENTASTASPSRLHHLKQTTLNGDGSGSTRSRPASPAPSGFSDDETEADEEDNALAFEVEPGIDVHRSDFSDIYNKEHLNITVADWCSRKAKVRQNLSNEKFLRWLDTPRPSWSKARWINLTGLNWRVFKAIATKYELHPLAVEDCLHVFDASARSKSDTYTNHLFVRLNFSQLGHPEDTHSDSEEEEFRAAAGTRTALDEEEAQRRRHAAFQKKVDRQGRQLQRQQQQQQEQNLRVPARPSASPNGASNSFKVSRTTGRLSHSKPKHSMDRVPTVRKQSRRSRMAAKAPEFDRRKDTTGLEADSILSRAWTKLSGGSVSFAADPEMPPKTRTLTARHFESEEADVGFTTRDVAENPFEETPTAAAEETASDDGHSDSEDDAYFASRKVIQALTHRFRLPLRRQQLSIFMLRDGTVLTLFSKDGSEIIPSVIARLKSRDTLLRNSEDASMLVQGLLDTCVDKSLDVIDAFKRKLDMLEGTSLVSPQIATVQHLHVMSQQLSQMRGSVVPLQNLISTLRSGEEDRLVMSAAGRSAASAQLGIPGSPTASKSKESAPGFISSTTRVYLKDVLDHADSVVSSLDLLMGNSEALVGYIFNSINFSSNETMKSLTFVSLVFLPLSFVCGYAGMNYTSFPGVTGEDDTVTNFYYAAVPLTLGTILTIALPDIIRLFKTGFRKYQHAKFAKQRHQYRRRLRKRL